MSSGFRMAARALALATVLVAGGVAAAEEDADGLTRAERAQLEEMAKATGMPVEQLIREMEENEKRMAQRHAGAARGGDTPAAAGSTAGNGWLLPLLGGAGLAVGVVGLALALRARRAGGGRTPGTSAPPAKSAAAQPEGWLIDIHALAGHAPRRLTDKPMVVGRTAGNDPDLLDYYVVPNNTIGRRHAVIRFRDGSFWLVDQGSVNGCFVNGERVAGERQLRHGDRLKFHVYEFEFQHPGAAGAAVVSPEISADRTLVATAAAMAAPAAVAVDTEATLVSDLIPDFDGSAATVLLEASSVDPLAATLPSVDAADVLGEDDAFAATMMAPSAVPAAPPPVEDDAFAATMMAPSAVPAAPPPVEDDASAFFDDFVPTGPAAAAPAEVLEATLALPPEEPDFDTATTIMPSGMMPAALLEETARIAGPSAQDMLADTVRMSAADLEATQIQEAALLQEAAPVPVAKFDATLLDDFGMSAPLPDVDLPIDVKPPADDEPSEPTLKLEQPLVTGKSSQS